MSQESAAVPRGDAGLPIVDAHHHLFDKVPPTIEEICGCRRFLLDEYLAYIGNEHNLVASILMEAHAMYRVDGPEALRPVGETEFFNGQAAMAASGIYGPAKVGAGIVGFADLRLGDAAREVLEAHIAAAPARFKGIRQEAMWDADPTIIGHIFAGSPKLYNREEFRRGFKYLAPLGLSFDAFVLAPQLADVLDLARSFPDTQIILNHVGNPVGIGAHAGKFAVEYPEWKQNITAIAACPNVVVKLGGLGSFLAGSPNYRCTPPASVEAVVKEWSPHIEVALQAFGPHRCMFESNLPTDGSGSFSTVCNAFKVMLAGYSDDEKRDVFARTAARIYRLDLPTLRVPSVA